MAGIQRYVTSELTHFVGRGLSEGAQYDLLTTILNTGRLAQPGYNDRFGPTLTVNLAGSTCDGDMFSPQMVCFCDIPVADLDIHMAKYSRFGIAFAKQFLAPRGATPVFYIPKNSPPSGPERCGYFDAMIAEYDGVFKELELNGGDFELRRRVVDLRRFLEFGVFSFFKFFDVCLADDDPDNYYMEREWRLLGAVEFGLSDVQRVIVPNAYAERFRADTPAYFGQVTLLK